MAFSGAISDPRQGADEVTCTATITSCSERWRLSLWLLRCMHWSRESLSQNGLNATCLCSVGNSCYTMAITSIFRFHLSLQHHQCRNRSMAEAGIGSCARARGWLWASFLLNRMCVYLADPETQQLMKTCSPFSQPFTHPALG